MYSFVHLKCVIVITGDEKLRYRLISMLGQNNKNGLFQFTSETRLVDFLHDTPELIISNSVLVLHIDKIDVTTKDELLKLSKPIVFVIMDKVSFIQEIKIV